MLPTRVLVVDDFVPFRKYISAKLEKRDDLKIICEVSDGLAGVQKADELKPDLILLDIGLPTLNGIEAARQIRQLSPASKILFVTLEFSADVVREAFSLGASGYVAKIHAARDLRAAVDAVLQGQEFVSGGLSYHRHTLTRVSRQPVDSESLGIFPAT